MIKKFKAFAPGNRGRDLLLLSCMALMGLFSYVTYDIPGAVNIDIELDLGIKKDDFMLYFYSTYAFSSCIIAILAGLIIAKTGLANAGLIFSGLLTFAHFLIACSMYFRISLLSAVGRIIHGCSAEPLGVVRSSYVGKYFNSSLFYGIILAVSRAGSVLGFKLAPWVLCLLQPKSPTCVIGIEKSVNGSEPIVANQTDTIASNFTKLTGLFDPEEGYPINSSLATCFLIGGAFAACISIFVMTINFFDKKIEKQLNPDKKDEKKKAKTISVDLITDIPSSAWYLIILFMCFYSAMFPFNSILPGFLKSLGYKKEVAGNLASVVYAFSCIGSPLFGFIIDYTGFHSLWLTFCSGLLTFSFGTWGYLQKNVYQDDQETMLVIMYVLMLCLGVAYSIISSSAMKYMVEVTPIELHPTCFGLLMGIQQIGIGAISYFIGWYIEGYGYVSDDGNFLYVFAAVGLIATVFGLALISNDGINPFKKKEPEEEVSEENEQFVDETS